MELITQEAELERVARHCAKADWLAVDTEFIRERTYFAELCLVQLGWPGGIALIDALALPSLSGLAEVLCEAGIIKLMHAPRQDMEVLQPILGAVPGPLFDTQVAAALCGAPPQVSYSALVAERLGVDLGSSQARTDWSRRPLAEKQLRYAADDVEYLPGLHAALSEDLAELGRRAWFDEEMAAQQDVVLFVEPDEAWRRVKGGGRLVGAALSVLVALAAWREREAVRRNLPRRWLLADEVLCEIARRMPRERQALAAVEGLSAKQVRQEGEALCALIAEAADRPPPTVDLREPDRALVKRLQGRVRVRGAELGLDPSVLATRADITALALGAEGSRLLQGWRREVIGEQLLAELS